jgi:gamma-glutamyltranspeptidase / glutathione hydrolase
MNNRAYVRITAATIFAAIVVAVVLQAMRPLREQSPVLPQDFGDPVRAEHGMVVSASKFASEAGVEILKRGGNAVDAAVATGFALAVTYPSAGNLGGGGFMVIRLADGRTTTIDFREKAPLEALRDMYIDSTGAFRPDWSQRGYLAPGVPGSPAGLLLAHERYGRLPLADVMAPVIRLASEGFALSEGVTRGLNGLRSSFLEYPSTTKYFTTADSLLYEIGDTLRQSDLAAVLMRIRDEGWEGFYRGRTADLIVAEMERGDGLISHTDLEAYQAVERPPVTGTYRGHRIISMGPPSSGGIGLIQLLNAVEPYDIREMGYNSSETIHLMGESMRRVYADRAHWLGDADFFPVPVSELIDKNYMRRQMANFQPFQVDSSASVTYGDPYARESMETTHYSVVDVEGNAVAVTTTLNGSYGSHVVVDGAGFFLNNEMDDFSARPDEPNLYGLLGGEANAIQPGKRMLSSMTPTIVEDPEGRLMLVIGTPGGSTIITTVFQVVVNVVDHWMNIQEAVSAPRIHHQWMPDELRFEDLGLARDVVRNLETRGWEVRETSTWGAADGITVQYGNDGRVYYGGADPRGEDVAVGY